MRSIIVGLLGLAVLASVSNALVGKSCNCPPPPQGPRCPPPPRCPPCTIRRWRRVTPTMVLKTVSLGVSITLTGDSPGGLVIRGLVTRTGCGGPGSGSVIYIRGDWTQIRYTQEFRGSASCWKIFGATAYQKYRKSFAIDGTTHHTNNLEDFDASQGDGIFNELHMNTNQRNAFDGKVYRCDNEQVNFWHGRNGAGLRQATVMLRRRVNGNNAGISTETSCGRPTYVINDIWVLM